VLRFLSALSLLCLSLTAVAASPPISDQLAKRIDADVQTVLQRTGTPGATILIAEHGRIVYRRAYGLRDRERHVPATVDIHNPWRA